MFLVREAFDGFGVLAVGQPAQGARQAHADIAGIFALPEALPLGVLGGVEDFRQVARRLQAGIALEVEKIRSGGGQKGRVGGGGDVGNALEQLDIFRMLAEFVIPDQRAEWRSAEGAELLFIDLLE